jgi:hypothetical protein
MFVVENDVMYTLVKLLMGHKSQCKKQICSRGVVNKKENGCNVL